ncbi:MAG: transcriptional regulator [Clostridiaceae bacterium]|nr:transcriptional regulator [Clostridiaceae bacterium]
MDVQKLKQLLSQEECEKLDFKAELHISTESEKRELVKDVTAMANTRGGRGHIIFGIEDKTKRILGINPKIFLEEQIQQVIYSRTDPPVPVKLDLINIEDKTVAVITIFRSKYAPHQMVSSGAFFVRRGSTTDVMRRTELASAMQENGLMTYETVIVRDAVLDDLDMGRINNFLASMNVSVDQPQYILMEAFGFIASAGNSQYFPTIGGILLFGKNPQIFLPQCYVKITHETNTEIIYGNIFELLEKATERISKIINNNDYPIVAVEEALANALVHRDYLDMSRGVSVVITDKTIEIINPGAFTGGSRVYNHMKDWVPQRRNAWLYQRLISIDEKRRFMKTGIGINRIRKALNKIGAVKFINLGKQNSFKVVLPR